MSILQQALHRLRSDGLFAFLSAAASFLSRKSSIAAHNKILSLPPDILIKYIHLRSSIHPAYTSGDPLKKIYVDPNEITHYSKLKRPIRWGRVSGGDWDQPTDSFVDRDIVQGIHQYIQSDEDELLRNAICSRLERAERPVWGYEGVENVDERIKDIDDLIKSIESNGYQLQTTIKCGKETTDWRGTYYYPQKLNEVTVNIGRDGSLYYVYCGQHRLAIAQALELDRIPVLVSVRHKKWEKIRNTIADATSTEEIPVFAKSHTDHPDMKELHP